MTCSASPKPIWHKTIARSSSRCRRLLRRRESRRRKTMNMKLCVGAFALAFLIPGVALAQGPAGGGVDQSLKGVELKGKVPVNREVLKINLPKSQETTLKNGLRVVVIEYHKVPTFTMQMVILSGGLADPSS